LPAVHQVRSEYQDITSPNVRDALQLTLSFGRKVGEIQLFV